MPSLEDLIAHSDSPHFLREIVNSDLRMYSPDNGNFTNLPNSRLRNSTVASRQVVHTNVVVVLASTLRWTV